MVEQFQVHLHSSILSLLIHALLLNACCSLNRGTLVAHPLQENKTQGIDNELTARLKGQAEASRR